MSSMYYNRTVGLGCYRTNDPRTPCKNEVVWVNVWCNRYSGKNDSLDDHIRLFCREHVCDERVVDSNNDATIISNYLPIIDPKRLDEESLIEIEVLIHTIAACSGA